VELPPEVARAPQASELEVPGGSEFDQAKPDATPVVPQSEPTSDSTIVSGLVPPDDGGSTTRPNPPTDSAGTPLTAETTATLASPGSVSTAAPALTSAEGAPVANDTIVSLQDPGAISPIAVDTAPADPPAPVAEVAENIAPEPEEEASPIVTAAVVPEVETIAPAAPVTPDVSLVPETPNDPPAEPLASESVEPSPEVTVPDVTAPEVATPEISAPEVSVEQPTQPAEPETEPSAVPAVEAEVEPEPTPAPVAESEPAPAPTVEAEAEPEPAPEAEPEVAALPEVAVIPEPEPTPEPEPEPEPTPEPEPEPEASPGIRMPVPEITNRAPGVTTNRLPSIGGTTQPEESEDQPAADEVAALERNAVGFVNEGDRPLFSIIILDEGADEETRKAAMALPVSVSFALNAADPETPARAAKYREAGFEVLMMLSLPQGATPSDVEVAFQSASAAMPDAVAVMDAAEGGFGSSRQTATQLAEILAETGHGMVVYKQGLNAAQQIATREGVHAATVFRSFDDDQDAAPVIRRYLDRAAFRAQQEGHVVMVGHLYPETLVALAEWAVEDRAANLAIAPISSLLLERP